MQTFDKQYYDDIWGTIHRHDYCESLADFLISKYGICKILDVGTGCGELVRILREKGCYAWGADISDYALVNSCAPGYVVKAHASSLPFATKSFDVVHSNGLFGYDENIQEMWKELNRVGRIQAHNIDYDDDIPEHQLIVIKSREWWDEQLKPVLLPKVLVSCPVYDGKEYCMQKWIDNVKNLTYSNYDIIAVDNSKTEDFYNKYRDQIPMVHLTFRPDEKDDAMYRVCKSMAEVQRHFIKGGYEYWMNIETDNIPPKNVIETMMKYGQDADWVEHAYFTHPGGGTLQQGIGCGLLSRKLMTAFDWDDTTIADDSPDAELWNWVQKQGIYKTVELWYIMDVKHLKEGYGDTN